MTQSADSAAQQIARDEVQERYPDVYRSDEDLRNHAFAIAQQQVDNNPQQSSGNPMAVQNYAEAYISAYNQAVQERDAQR
jgi:hypothetical protein